MCTYRGQGVNAGRPTLLTFILFSEFFPCACVCGRCLWRLAERTLDSLELELWVVCWGPNFRLLKQQQALLTADPSLRPHLSLNLGFINRGWPASPRDSSISVPPPGAMPGFLCGHWSSGSTLPSHWIVSKFVIGKGGAGCPYQFDNLILKSFKLCVHV